MFDQIVSNFLEGVFQITLNLGFPSYAIAIVVIAVLIRMVLLPLNISQMKSTVGMQAIQPQMKEIQEKYANNPELMQQKTMELYQEYGVNPMAGCLPLLIQFPIMIALYQGLRAFVPSQPEFYNFLWIPDLGDIDATHIMVILVAASTFIQSYITTGKPTQPMQWYMLIAMPVMMGWMAAKFPAFLCIYWITITVVGIFQQLVINKPMRKKLQERAAELEEERKQKAANRGNNSSKHKKADKTEKIEKSEKADKSEQADKPKETGNADGEVVKKRRRRTR